MSQLFTNTQPGVKFRNASNKETEKKIINSLNTKKNLMIMMKYQQKY